MSPLEPIFEIRFDSAVSSGLHYIGDIRHASVLHTTRVQREDARIHQPRVQIVAIDGQRRMFAMTIIRMLMRRSLIILLYGHLWIRNPCLEVILISLFGSQMRHCLVLNLFLDHVSDGLYAIKRCFPLPSMCVIRLTVLVNRIFAI